MKLLKTVTSISAQNLRKWQTDYRVWTIAVLLVIMVQICVDDMRTLAGELGTEIPIWIFPFMYQQFHTKLIYTMPVLLLFCNAPFTDQNQIFVYMRTGRKKWLSGQVLYIVTASALYYAFLLIVSLLSTVFYGDGTMDWGNTLTTIARTNVALVYNCPFAEASYMVIKFFTPLQAVWFTFLLSWLGAMLIGLVIFLFNLVSGSRFLGVLISSIPVVLSAIADDAYVSVLPFSPISWNTLNNVDVGGLTKKPSFTYCLTVYLVSIAVLIAAIFIFGRKKSLDIKED